MDLVSTSNQVGSRNLQLAIIQNRQYFMVKYDNGNEILKKVITSYKGKAIPVCDVILSNDAIQLAY